MTIRIADETQDVRTKASARGDGTPVQRVSCPPEDIDIIARNAFFEHYVNELSQAWGILLKYRNSDGMPEHLSLSLDAVSLAFMAHHTQYTVAKDLGRKKYVSALRMFNKELQSADSIEKASTFEGALLLDLFEQMAILITEETAPRHAHVEGALALAKLRGVETFREEDEYKALLGLSLNAAICCLTEKEKISDPIRIIREHAGRYVVTTDLSWKLSGVLMDFVDLSSDLYTSTMTEDEKATRCVKLDGSIEAISCETTGKWSYESCMVPAPHKNGFLPDDAQHIYNRYPCRAVMQTWNILRTLRILLYEELTALRPNSPQPRNSPQPPTCVTMIQQICASVPCTTDCSFAASFKLPPSSPCQHPQPLCQDLSHTVSHAHDAYVLVLPLYVAAWSRYCSLPTRLWILGQLERIATHFGVTEASVAESLLLDDMDADNALDSWYALRRTLNIICLTLTRSERRKQLDYMLSRHISDFYGLIL